MSTNIVSWPLSEIRYYYMLLVSSERYSESNWKGGGKNLSLSLSLPDRLKEETREREKFRMEQKRKGNWK